MSRDDLHKIFGKFSLLIPMVHILLARQNGQFFGELGAN